MDRRSRYSSKPESRKRIDPLLCEDSGKPFPPIKENRPVDVRLGQADLARNVGETDIFQSIFSVEMEGGEEDGLLRSSIWAGRRALWKGSNLVVGMMGSGSHLTRDRWSLI